MNYKKIILSISLVVILIVVTLLFFIISSPFALSLGLIAINKAEEIRDQKIAQVTQDKFCGQVKYEVIDVKCKAQPENTYTISGTIKNTGQTLSYLAVETTMGSLKSTVDLEKDIGLGETREFRSSTITYTSRHNAQDQINNVDFYPIIQVDEKEQDCSLVKKISVPVVCQKENQKS